MGKSKRYMFRGQIYCDDDLSFEVPNYGGDLYGLFWEMEKAGHCRSVTTFETMPDTGYPVRQYDSAEDFVAEECKGLEVDDHG